MSLMSMRRKMASKQTATIILWLLIIVFMATAVIWNLPGKNTRSNASPGDSTVVVTINGADITRGEVDAAFAQMETRANSAQQALTLNSALDARKSVIDQAITRVLTEQATKKLHCEPWSLTWHSTMSDIAGELAVDQVNQMRDEATKKAAAPEKDPSASAGKKRSSNDIFKSYLQGAMFSEKSPYSNFAEQGTEATPSAFKDVFVNYWLTSQEEKGNLEEFETIARTALIGKAVVKSLKVSPVSATYVQKLNIKELQASWIFIANKDDSVKGLADAKAKANTLREQAVKNPAAFADIAKMNSDDFMGKMNGGALASGSNSWYQGNATQDSQYSPPPPPPTVEYLAFSTEKGQVSPIEAIQTEQSMFGQPQTGYAFVYVKDMRDRTDLKGYKWDSARAAAVLHAKIRYENAFGQTYVALQRIEAKIVRLSPEMKYFDLSKNDQTKADELLPALAKDTTLPNAVRAAFKYQLAQKTQDPTLYDSEVFSFSSTKAPDIYLELAKLYEKKNNVDDALTNLKSAADNCENRQSSDLDDNKLHEDIKAEYVKLNALPTATPAQKIEITDGNKRMDEWLLQHPKKASGSNPSGAITMPMH